MFISGKSEKGEGGGGAEEKGEGRVAVRREGGVFAEGKLFSGRLAGAEQENIKGVDLCTKRG